MKLSRFGEKFSAPSGIVQLMDDLGDALKENPDMIMMGGGNPGRLPRAEELFSQALRSILDDPDRRHRLMGLYQSPHGDREFRTAVADYLKQSFGWNVSAANVSISNGSQSAFFILFNLFAGEMGQGENSRIQLPLAPEYLGYADNGLGEDFFHATRPDIELLDRNLFKYRVDFEALEVHTDTAALVASRPTNPTGNVLTDSEVRKLDQLARDHEIPLIIDGAYGLPFPRILFTDAEPHWNENTILVLSLSKIGLPGVRTGIVIAREDIIDAYARANSIVSLACGNFGPAIATELFNNGGIRELTDQHITRFYYDRARQAAAAFRRELEGLPFHIHKPEGAFFLWLWFDGLPISCQELYRRLRERGVLVVPGHHCFFGLEQPWAHRDECIRVSYVQDPKDVERGIRLIAEEVKKAYR